MSNGPADGTLALRLQADRLRFPGMLPAETLIFKQWLAEHEGEYDRFEYNVRIGSGTDPGEKYPQEIRDMAIANSQKRLDAVGWQADIPTIIEVKRRAGLSNIGQLVGYKHFWIRDNPDQPSPNLLLITNALQSDILHVAEQEHIAIALVDADFSLLRRPGAPLSGHKHARQA